MCKYKGLILNMQVTKGFISQAYSNLLKLKREVFLLPFMLFNSIFNTVKYEPFKCK